MQRVDSYMETVSSTTCDSENNKWSFEAHGGKCIFNRMCSTLRTTPLFLETDGLQFVGCTTEICSESMPDELSTKLTVFISVLTRSVEVLGKNPQELLARTPQID